jgi:hypothetical protein
MEIAPRELVSTAPHVLDAAAQGDSAWGRALVHAPKQPVLALVGELR